MTQPSIQQRLAELPPADLATATESIRAYVAHAQSVGLDFRPLAAGMNQLGRSAATIFDGYHDKPA